MKILFLLLFSLTVFADEDPLPNFKGSDYNKKIIIAYMEEFDRRQAAKTPCEKQKKVNYSWQVGSGKAIIGNIVFHMCSGECVDKDKKFVKMAYKFRSPYQSNTTAEYLANECPKKSSLNDDTVECGVIQNGDHSFNTNSPKTKGSESTLAPSSSKYAIYQFCKSYCNNADGSQAQEVSIGTDSYLRATAMKLIKAKCTGDQILNFDKLRCAHVSGGEYNFMKIRDVE